MMGLYACSYRGRRVEIVAKDEKAAMFRAEALLGAKYKPICVILIREVEDEG